MDSTILGLFGKGTDLQDERLQDSEHLCGIRVESLAESGRLGEI